MAIANVNRRQFQDLVSQVITELLSITIASLTTGSDNVTTITVPGARVGDLVDVQFQAVTNLSIFAEVTANDTIKIYAHNGSGSTQNNGAQNAYVTVYRFNSGLFA